MVVCSACMQQRLWVIFILIVGATSLPLRFNPDGRFKILQVADMHYANGGSTKCKDVLLREYASCSDLNTTAFVQHLIAAEKPDLIVFSGDNIFGRDAVDPVGSLNAAFAPAIQAQIPWVAILGNHDQESTLSRLEVMEHIVKMDYTLSQVYPTKVSGAALGGGMQEVVDGFGNYHLEIRGAMSSPFENKSVLNLYMLDSGDYSKIHKVHGYGWIQESQKKWFRALSAQLKDDFQRELAFQNETAQALVYFHIPLVEARQVAGKCSITGVKQEAIGCAQVNSGFLDTMREVGDARAIFNGHDHVNDFCGDLPGNIKMCYGGGVGYHAYGKAGWSRRARVVEVSLRVRDDDMITNASSFPSNETKPLPKHPQWLGVVYRISTWKRLDRPSLPIIDHEVLWSRLPISSKGSQGWNIKTSFSLVVFVLIYLLICFIFSSWWPFDCTIFARFSSSRRRHYGYSMCKI